MGAGSNRRRRGSPTSFKEFEKIHKTSTVRSTVTEREAREVMASGTSAAPKSIIIWKFLMSSTSAPASRVNVRKD